MANYKTGDIIRLTRIATGMSQEELSDGICSVETLSRIENGKHKIKKDTYYRLMARMERTPGKNYAVCSGKNMSLLEERREFETAMRKFDYALAEEYLTKLKSKIADDAANQQYLKKAEALVEYHNKRIGVETLIELLEEAIRITIPEYETYLEKIYPYTEQEVLNLMNLANAYRNANQKEKAMTIYQALLDSLGTGYMMERDRATLEIVIMRNMALVLGELERYEESTELLIAALKRSKERRYGHMLPTALAQIAWNIMHQIERGEVDVSEAERAKCYTRQAYYIAAARDEYKIKESMREYYEKTFGEKITIS